MIDVVPARLGFEDDYAVLDEVDSRINDLIAGGLRARLATGNLLTGHKTVELRYFDDNGGDVQSFAGYSVIPSAGGDLDQLLANASRTLEIINDLPLDNLFVSAQEALGDVSLTLTEIRESAVELEKILADPASHALVGTLNDTLAQFRKMAVDFSEGSATNRDLQQSLHSLEQTLIELEPVLRNLRRRPNSLIFGGGDAADPEPQAVPR